MAEFNRGRGGFSCPPPHFAAETRYSHFFLTFLEFFKEILVLILEIREGGGRKTPLSPVKNSIFFPFFGDLLQIINDYPQLVEAL